MLKALRKVPAFFYILIAILLVVALAFQFLPVDEWTDQLNQWVQSLGSWGPVAFVLIYIVATVFLIPASPLSILAGLIFSWWGLPLVLLGATVGACLAFLGGRYIARDRVSSFAENNRTFGAVDEAVEEEGWKVVLMMRLSPAVPFNLQNYFFGTTAVSFWSYALATAGGIIPGAAVYVYIGTLGSGGGSGEGGGGVLKWSLLGAGLVVTALMTWFLSRKAKARLDQYGVDNDE